MVALRACISMAHAINGLKREHHQLMHPVQYMTPKQTGPRPIELSSSTTHQEAIYLSKQCRNIYCMYDMWQAQLSLATQTEAICIRCSILSVQQLYRGDCPVVW